MNRIDDVIIFETLDRDAIFKIIDIELAGFLRRMSDLGFTVTVSDEAKNFIASKGCDVQFGARPLKRAIQKYLEDELAQVLLGGNVKPGDEIIVGIDPDTQKIITQVIEADSHPHV